MPPHFPQPPTLCSACTHPLFTCVMRQWCYLVQVSFELHIVLPPLEWVSWASYSRSPNSFVMFSHLLRFPSSKSPPPPNQLQQTKALLGRQAALLDEAEWLSYPLTSQRSRKNSAKLFSVTQPRWTGAGRGKWTARMGRSKVATVGKE